VDEFASRLFEEMDFDNEVTNLQKFNSLYGRGGSVTLPAPGVRVPGVLAPLCSRNVIVMEVGVCALCSPGVQNNREDSATPLVPLSVGISRNVSRTCAQATLPARG